MTTLRAMPLLTLRRQLASALELVERPAQPGEFLLVLSLAHLRNVEQFLDFLQLVQDLAQRSHDLLDVGQGLAERFAAMDGLRGCLGRGCRHGRHFRRQAWR